MKIDLKQGFAKGHTTRDVEVLCLDEIFQNAGKKKNLQYIALPDKTKRALEKLAAFTSKARKRKENT